ncbi:hypothetical protein B4135_3588 [Caldibacillus debilis]|uniref:Uncharacterized protein n=1 Tax=Caldibacillus debilis TaxID=301148 RepID=A0A150LDL7_9BACI|nr:hypothetical protein B4135_3588 [Caldibacillus debilis]
MNGKNRRAASDAEEARRIFTGDEAPKGHSRAFRPDLSHPNRFKISCLPSKRTKPYKSLIPLKNS